MIGKHLATFNLFREADHSLQITIAEAQGVRSELGDSGAPLALCAMNALYAAVDARRKPPLSPTLHPSDREEGFRHRLCLLIEDMCPERDDHTDIAIGSEVEALADAILALSGSLGREGGEES